MIESFKDHLEALSGEFFMVPDIKEAAAVCQSLTGDLHKGFRQEVELVDALISEMGNPETISPADGLTNAAMADSDFAVTVCDYLIARTGSIMLRCTSAGGRRLSVLPPFHIVIARQSQLRPSMDACLTDIPEDDWSYTTIITGPARTADIEKILVLGAHGPKRLAVICIAD